MIPSSARPLVQLGAALLGSAAVGGLADQRVCEAEGVAPGRAGAVDADELLAHEGDSRVAVRRVVLGSELRQRAVERPALTEACARTRARPARDGRCGPRAPPGSSSAACPCRCRPQRAARGTAGCPRRFARCPPRAPRRRRARRARAPRPPTARRARARSGPAAAPSTRAATRPARGARGRRAGSGAPVENDHDVLEQVQQRRLGPVDVVDDDDERTRGGDALEQPADGPERLLGLTAPSSRPTAREHRSARTLVAVEQRGDAARDRRAASRSRRAGGR